MKDVVGMIRSFDYAAFAALFAFAGDDRSTFDRLVPDAKAWRTWTSATFLKEYLATTAGASFLPRKTRPSRPDARCVHARQSLV